MSLSVFDRADPSSPLSVPAQNTALLLLDYHTMFLGMVDEQTKTSITTTAKSMLDFARSNSMPVLHCLVDKDQDPPSTLKGRERVEKLIAAVLASPEGYAEYPALAPGDGTSNEPVFKKRAGVVSAHKSPGMMEYLAQHNIKSLIICGISTSGAVLRTSVPLSDEGYIISIISDACADPVPGIHDTLMKSVLPSRCHVCTAEEFQKAWTKT